MAAVMVVVVMLVVSLRFAEIAWTRPVKWMEVTAATMKSSHRTCAYFSCDVETPRRR